MNYIKAYNLIKLGNSKDSYILFTGGLGNMGEDFKRVFDRNKSYYKIFRHNLLEKALKYLDGTKNKKNLKIYGHSWGSQPALKLGKKFKDALVHLIDPVSYTDTPVFYNKKSKVYYPDNKYIVTSNKSFMKNIKLTIGNFIAIFGNRISKLRLKASPSQVVTYAGNHLKGVSLLVEKNINKDITLK